MSTTTIVLIVVAVVLLLLIVAGLTFYLLRKKKTASTPTPEAAAGAEPAPAADASAPSELESILKAAQLKLAQSKSGMDLRKLPAILLMGPQGAAKTTAAVRCGIDAELLAGQAQQGAEVVPTRLANVWFARNAAWIEAGAPIQSGGSAWSKLIGWLRPSAAGSLFSGAPQAPRVAVVCMDCERFQNADAAVAEAQKLRARLIELSNALASRVPVYVLFTKLDRVPYFLDYVQGLTHEEAMQPLGVTLAFDEGVQGGVYAERETARLSEWFNGLYLSLCDWRTEVLPRQFEVPKRPNSYEFPREFRKLRPAAVAFLMELCRPNQLAPGPWLRGFYFTGVRPVVMQTGDQREGRRVPQWTFLPPIFTDVLLGDRAALAASAASSRGGSMRRIASIVLAMIGLILATGFLVSFLGNRALTNEALAAAQDLGKFDAQAIELSGPTLDSLKRLDRLRVIGQELAGYEREGAPWRLRWGLYSGSDVFPLVRKIYFTRFRDLLLADTQRRMVNTMRGFPDQPGPSDSSGYAYDTLKAYLITTTHPDKSTRPFLSPALRDRWSENRQFDSERMKVAGLQFDFYADELPHGNPFSADNDASAISHARDYLSRFGGLDRVYQYLLSEAGKTNRPVNFNAQFPGSAQVVVNNKDVPGAFTAGGYKFVQDALKDTSRFVSGEKWVLGDAAESKIDSAGLATQLRTRYLTDFVEQWRAYLKRSEVVGYSNLGDAATKLRSTASPQSPLLAMFWLASQNTGVDAPEIQRAFKPLHTVMPPANKDQYISPANKQYMDALVSLQVSIEDAGKDTPPSEQAVNSAQGAASNATLAIRQAAVGFGIDPEGKLEATVQKLMEDPITYADRVLRVAKVGDINAKGGGMCGQLNALLSKRPFNRTAGAEASMGDFNGFFQPKNGALWVLYESSLREKLQKFGTTYMASPSGGSLNPAFVSFFGRAASVSDAVYRAGDQPRLNYRVRLYPIEGVRPLTLTIDGQSVRVTNRPEDGSFAWTGTGSSARLSGNIGGTEVTFQSADGPWAPFYLFGDAERWTPSGSGYAIEIPWRSGTQVNRVGDKPVIIRMDLDFAGGPALFRRDFLRSLGCVATVAR